MSGASARTAAIAAAIGFAGLAVFQLLLAAGAPYGEAAWGGNTEGRLPAGLRVGSAISVVVYAGAAAVVLRRAGFGIRLPSVVARIGTWVLVVLLTLGALANFASQSPWERFLLGPVALLLAGLCFVVAGSPVDRAASSVRQARTSHSPGADERREG
ncbi:hypothetical protein AB0H36_06360 [Kribbella sp. NPDC050820]|uniref:hypothetical protein n=1 Tax=Kribbella sp. NPDC050820 TaxID=3155408 RepID=UPI0033DA85E0